MHLWIPKLYHWADRTVRSGRCFNDVAANASTTAAGRASDIGIAGGKGHIAVDDHGLHFVIGVYLARGVAVELPAVEAVSAVGCDSGLTGDREARNDSLVNQTIARVGEAPFVPALKVTVCVVLSFRA